MRNKQRNSSAWHALVFPFRLCAVIFCSGIMEKTQEAKHETRHAMHTKVSELPRHPAVQLRHHLNLQRVDDARDIVAPALHMNTYPSAERLRGATSADQTAYRLNVATLLRRLQDDAQHKHGEHRDQHRNDERRDKTLRQQYDDQHDSKSARARGPQRART
jgi:hypothetical protein